MGLGKILGLAAIGVGAVALAPFTGGGSVAGAATLAGSLAGAEAAATGAAVIGGAVGAAASRREEEKKYQTELKYAKIAKEAKNDREKLSSVEEHYSYILTLTALGVAMANADGNISYEERVELDEFVGGLSSEKYPIHIRKEIKSIIKNPPTFNEALILLEKNSSQINFKKIRDILIVIMEADGNIHKREIAFLEAFDNKIKLLAL